MGIFEEVVKACEDNVQSSYSSDEIYRFVKKTVPNPKPGTILPSDYCYNRINKGIDFTKHVFISIGDQYKFVGRSYPFSGPIYWSPLGSKDRVVGVWRNGRFELWEDFPKVSMKNPKRVVSESIEPTGLEVHEANFSEQLAKSLRG